jgi:hypothetical protein
MDCTAGLADIVGIMADQAACPKIKASTDALSMICPLMVIIRRRKQEFTTTARATEKIAPQASRVFECAVRTRRILVSDLFSAPSEPGGEHGCVGWF